MSHGPPAWKPAFENMAETIKDPTLLLRLQAESPGLAAPTRNTCSITMLEGSNKVNVVPTEASAQIDCRMLPEGRELPAGGRMREIATREPGCRQREALRVGRSFRQVDGTRPGTGVGRSPRRGRPTQPPAQPVRRPAIHRSAWRILRTG